MSVGVKTYTERKARGICIQCGKRRGFLGRLLCQECAEDKNALAAAWKKGNAARMKGYALSARYGITTEVYLALLEAQGGVCKICGSVNKNGKGLAVDHCHTTGKVRGLLCNNCNTAIGKLGDTPEGLMRAVRYLEAA